MSGAHLARADRSLPRMQRTQDGRWTPDAPEGPEILSDAEILSVLRDAVSAVCPALASATIVAQVRCAAW